MSSPTEERKTDHLKISLGKNVKAKHTSPGFEDIHLVHKALPEIEREMINLSTIVFDHKFSAPLIVGAMTGGVREAMKINRAIAEAVEETGLGMGLGSQRAAIEDPSREKTFAVVREKAPTAFLMANIGGPQLVRGYGIEEAKKAVDMIDADVLAIHLNPLQETIQLEGETNYMGILRKIGEIAKAIDVPVIVKETGAGISAEEAEMLEAARIAGIDVAGVGGTSWAAVEYYRAERDQNELGQRLGKAFWDWGIPTVTSLIETAQSVDIPVIASGGVRSGIDVAKALSLGASLASMALPILPLASEGKEKVKKGLQLILEELRNTMFLVGAASVGELEGVPAVITGRTAEWLRTRGFHPEIYAER
ncbi:MAG: type 2 isopentenyl-diphosphate Delta-isomerase [Candidatus Bathyarchaeota archaeon]|nr:MAG: type 2 isopentenyl-diphosphate Delta-isomerase [Candidatus Bathyarchaeota archaeon]